jgi:hypothetical protein
MGELAWVIIGVEFFFREYFFSWYKGIVQILQKIIGTNVQIYLETNIFT